jgi:Fur family ferric uptake transcriptional regulator
MVVASELLGAFGRAGYRLTGPRRALAELIASRPGHFTVEELLVSSQRDGLGLGRATVFRALDTLTELGVVERLDLPTGEHAFVSCRPAHHHHVVCSACGRAAPVEGCGLSAMADEVARRTGYSVDTHRIELFGICPDCRASRA